jgi:drug/metabolite transporter (DMT)-like permease
MALLTPPAFVAPLHARWLALPGNIRGAIWIMLAAFWLTCMAVAIKLAGKTLSPWQIVLVRAWIALILVSPAIYRQGLGSLRTSRPLIHVMRSVFGFCGIITFVFAITHLNLALATTLGFTRTLFVIILAILFLGERLNLKRALATLAGFCGVVICTQPGSDGAFDEWMLVGLATAVFAAAVSTSVKNLTRTEAPLTILVWSYVIMGTFAAIPAFLTWKTPNLYELAVICLMSCFSALGQTCSVLGLRAGDATAVTPFDYSRLIYATAAGFFIFSEVPKTATLLGALIIVGATLYIALQSRKKPA